LDVNRVERSRGEGRPEGVVRQAQRIQVEDLSAEYSTGQRPDGEWFALGTVRTAGERFDEFPWVVVGTGDSQDDAIAQLVEKITHAAQAALAR
jgi:hypothetical protein